MKKIIYIKIVFHFFASICLLFTANSCNKALEMNSSHLVSEENEWKSITDTRSALLGIYGLFRAAIADNNGHWMWGELREGDFQSFVRQDLKAINDGKLNTSYELVNNLKSWRRFYAVINSASLFIEKAPKVLEQDPLYTENNMKIDIAQARVLRGLAYFYMCRIWGDVPLITKAYDNGTFPEQGKATQDQVLAFAERDILSAVNDLEYLYGTDGQQYYSYTNDRWNGALMTKNSAYTILAHIAAWRGNYIDAEAYTKFVYDHYTKSNINYVNISDLVAPWGIFNDKNARQIVAFNFVYAHGESSVNGHLEELTLASPLVQKNNPEIYVPKDTITRAFDDPQNRDSRFGIDTVSGLVRTNYFTNYSSATPIFSKIKVIRNGSTDGDYAVFGSAIILSRLEDVILLRAEALTALNRLTEAQTLLNVIRANRALPTIIVEKKDDLLKEIFAERRRELMGEGHRWYDQIRLNKLLPTNPKIVELIKNGGIYWPIAKDVLASNKMLEQNSYWK
jgi:hypothetical protein